MFIVLKSFTNGKITSSKNKVIDIKDKKTSDMLLKAGVVAPYSKKEQTNTEKDVEIANLNKTISDMQTIIDTLTAEKAELEAKLEEKNSDLASTSSENDGANVDDTADNSANSTENNDNLDKKDGKFPSKEDKKRE